MLKVTGGEGGDINFICPGARLALKVEKPPTRAHTRAHTDAHTHPTAMNSSQRLRWI